MIEVEAKAHITEPEKYLRIAATLGKFVRKERKVDEYYTLEELKRYPCKSLRIRKMHGFYIINFKQRLSFIQGVHAKKETEFRVSNIKDFLALIKDFGFKRWLRKEKETYLYEIKRNFHIEINKINKIGWFVEVEYLCDLKDISKARQKVLEIMHKLGIEERRIIKKGYTRMLWEMRD